MSINYSVNLSLSNSLHRHNLLPSLVEGGGKIEDFDGGSFAITHITPSVCFADSSLLDGADGRFVNRPYYNRNAVPTLCTLHFAFCILFDKLQFVKLLKL